MVRIPEHALLGLVDDGSGLAPLDRGVRLLAAVEEIPARDAVDWPLTRGTAPSSPAAARCSAPDCLSSCGAPRATRPWRASSTATSSSPRRTTRHPVSRPRRAVTSRRPSGRRRPSPRRALRAGRRRHRRGHREPARPRLPAARRPDRGRVPRVQGCRRRALRHPRLLVGRAGAPGRPGPRRGARAGPRLRLDRGRRPGPDPRPPPGLPRAGGRVSGLFDALVDAATGSGPALRPPPRPRFAADATTATAEEPLDDERDRPTAPQRAGPAAAAEPSVAAERGPRPRATDALVDAATGSGPAPRLPPRPRFAADATMATAQEPLTTSQIVSTAPQRAGPAAAAEPSVAAERGPRPRATDALVDAATGSGPALRPPPRPRFAADATTATAEEPLDDERDRPTAPQRAGPAAAAEPSVAAERGPRRGPPTPDHDASTARLRGHVARRPPPRPRHPRPLFGPRRTRPRFRPSTPHGPRPVAPPLHPHGWHPRSAGHGDPGSGCGARPAPARVAPPAPPARRPGRQCPPDRGGRPPTPPAPTIRIGTSS